MLYLAYIMKNKASYFPDGRYNFTKVHFILEEFLNKKDLFKWRRAKKFCFKFLLELCVFFMESLERFDINLGPYYIIIGNLKLFLFLILFVYK